MRALRALVLAMIVAFGLLYAYIGINRVFVVEAIDFASYYSAARLALDGQNIYDDAAREAMRVELGLSELPRYIYPPFLAAATKPLALLPFAPARLIWFIASVTALALSLGLLAKAVGLSRRNLALLVAAALLLPGTWITLWLGQVNMFLLLLIVLGLYFERRGKRRAAGMAIGAAALIKIFPVILIAYFALKRRFVVVAWSVVAIVALGALGALATGLDNQASFFSRGMSHLAEMQVAMPYDQSINAFFGRLFVPTPHTAPLLKLENGQLADILALMASGALAVAAAAVVKRGSEINPAGYSLAAITMLLVSARSWDHYAVFLLVPLATVLGECERRPPLAGEQPGRRTMAPAIGLPALFAYLLLVAQGYWVQMPKSVWLMSLGFYGMLLLWGCLVSLHWSKRFGKLSNALPREARLSQ